MGKKSRRARGGGRRGTPNSNSKVVSLTRHLLDDDEKIKKGYADGTLTINTLRTLEPTLRTAVARALGVDHVAAGDLVRAEVARGSALGRDVAAAVRRGALVPDALVTDLVGARVRAPGGFVLDGFPRTAAQAGALRDLSDVHLAVNLQMREEALIMKCLGRRTCAQCGTGYNLADVNVKPSGGRPGVYMPPLPAPPGCLPHLVAREDDVLEVVRERLEVHRVESQPVEGFYRQLGLLMDFEITQGIPETEPVLFGAIQLALRAREGNDGSDGRRVAA